MEWMEITDRLMTTSTKQELKQHQNRGKVHLKKAEENCQTEKNGGEIDRLKKK